MIEDIIISQLKIKNMVFNSFQSLNKKLNIRGIIAKNSITTSPLSLVTLKSFHGSSISLVTPENGLVSNSNTSVNNSHSLFSEIFNKKIFNNFHSLSTQNSSNSNFSQVFNKDIFNNFHSLNIKKSINMYETNQKINSSNSVISNIFKKDIFNNFHSLSNKNLTNDFSSMKIEKLKSENFINKYFLKFKESFLIENSKTENTFLNYITNKKTTINTPIISERIIRESSNNTNAQNSRPSFSSDIAPPISEPQVQNNIPITINATVQQEADIDNIISKLVSSLEANLGGQR